MKVFFGVATTMEQPQENRTYHPVTGFKPSPWLLITYTLQVFNQVGIHFVDIFLPWTSQHGEKLHPHFHGL